jgi:hypothetical protein
MTDKSQLDVPQSTVDIGADSGAFKILCIGDSITCHGFNEDTVSRLGWGHVAGMAASDASLDYAHRLQRRIGAMLAPRMVGLHFHTAGGSGSIRHRLSALAEVAPVAPHLVVIQLGEHEKESDGEQSLAASYALLLDQVRSFASHPLVIATGVWQPGEAYTGWAATIDRVFAQACQIRGIPFVSVADLATDPACHGAGTTPGVQWHPNDQGHAGYAEKLFAAFKSARTDHLS